MTNDEGQRRTGHAILLPILSNKIAVRSLNICAISTHCNCNNENRHTNQCPPVKRGCDIRDYMLSVLTLKSLTAI